MRVFRHLLAMSVLVGMSDAARASTLYEQLGAQAGVERLVAVATDIFVADPRISATFEDTNLVRFKQKLAEQLCQVSDGGCAYTGRSMQESHRGLHLGTKQFNVLVEDLQDAMDRVDIPSRVQNQLLARLAPMYWDVVTK